MGEPKNKKRKVFQEKWLEEPIFKEWLEKVNGNIHKCRCNVCNTTFVCGKSELEKHQKTEKHLEGMKAKRCNIPVSNFFKESSSPHDDSVKNAELILATFFAEHNVALHTIDHLIPALKQAIPDSKILKDIRLSRTKCAKIISNVIGDIEKEKLVQVLKVTKFSVMIDESTDITNGKNLCVIVRYVDSDFHVKTRLLDLLKVNATDCSAEALFKTFDDLMKKENIPLNNIVGLGCDGASVMVGSQNSFFSRLKQKVPKAVLISCICHSAALAANYSCNEIPSDCEKLLKNISTFVTESPKSAATLIEFQEYFDVKTNKILRPAKTRWLSLQPCVTRILDNWDVLKYFFIYYSAENERKKAQDIAQKLSCAKTKSYFLFLKYSLKYFNEFNALFQSRKVLIHALTHESIKILKAIAQNFVKSEALNDINIFNNKKYMEFLLSLDNIYLGAECSEYIKTNLNDEEMIEVKRNCQRFYIASVDQIVKRFPVTDPFLKALQFLSPSYALDLSKRLHCKDLKQLSEKIEECDKYKVEEEWRSLPIILEQNEREELEKMDVMDFWNRISKLKKIDNSYYFPNLSLIVKYALSLPHSNAEAERIFSMVTDIKTKKRNRIGEECLSAMCILRSNFEADNINCTTFQATEQHRKKMKKELLYK